MNRLWVRLTLAFILVILMGVGVVFAVAAWSADNQFRQYLARPDVFARNGLLDDLAEFYEQRGAWDGVAELLRASTAPRGHGRGMMMNQRPPLALANARGQIIYDERGLPLGRTLNVNERNDALPITLNNNVVGYLLGGGPVMMMTGAPELAFLNQLRWSLIIAAFVASSLGIVLGLFISRTIAAPLATLARAARAFAAKDWTQRVPVAHTTHIAEVAEVTHAFNDMADSLQQSETLRRNLMADIAHELRTPLTVIQGNLRALLDGVYPLELKEVATLYDETRLLSRLVDDVRELALAEAGQLPLNLQTVDIGALLRATATKFAAVAETQGIALQVTLPPSAPTVRADADRVAQVLQNLVTNALRHTPRGGRITLAVEEPRGAQGGNLAGLLHVSVSDTGEGIAPDNMPHVFERFYRGDKARARSGGSIGLGLTIAKSLIEAMGGTIGVESKQGAGSRFWFTLPTENLEP
jgi:two-component system OmpR family sensor kinase/two-component system sensor histidine kinase BaeS